MSPSPYKVKRGFTQLAYPRSIDLQDAVINFTSQVSMYAHVVAGIVSHLVH